MKYLKYLLYTILVFVILFLAAGFVMPKVKYGHKIAVNKSVKEAWAVHQDESKFDQWLKGFKSIDLISGEEGMPGSTYRIVVNPGVGQEDFEMTETLVSKIDFDHIAMDFDSEMMEFSQKTSFNEMDGKTTLKTESVVKGKGMMMRSMFALMEIFTGSFQRQEEENINNLKKVIEENTTDYYPVLEPEMDESDEEMEMSEN